MPPRWVRSVLVTMLVAPWLVCGASRGEAAETVLPEPSFYGIKTFGNNYLQFADDLRKVGIRWIVVDGWWNEKEADEVTLAAARGGVHLLAQLWMPRDTFDGGVDEGLKKYRQFVQASVKRYGPGGTLWKEHPEVTPLPIRYWSDWEEGDIGQLRPPEGVSRVELQAKILQVASEEFRKLDPGAKIIAFNTAMGTAICQPSIDNYMPDRKYYAAEIKDGKVKFTLVVYHMASTVKVCEAALKSMTFRS